MYLHAGRLATSADTSHGTPRFVNAPRIKPQGKYRYWPAALASSTVLEDREFSVEDPFPL